MEYCVRGYAVQATTQFVLGDAVVRADISPEFIKKIAAAEPTLKPATWYPRSQLREIYEAIANAAPNEGEAYARLARCGAATAAGAISGYMKLLMKVLTPRMFAAKFPDFWARDHQNGRATVSFPEEKRHMVFHIYDVDDFNHIGPVSAGVVNHLMGAIGEKGVEVRCEPWSLANPAPKNVNIDIRWQ